jgi:hypothetical protein
MRHCDNCGNTINIWICPNCGVGKTMEKTEKLAEVAQRAIATLYLYSPQAARKLEVALQDVGFIEEDQ